MSRRCVVAIEVVALLTDLPGTRGGVDFTPLQGQYLAYIRAYSIINGRAPAEADLQRFFGVNPMTIHQMILTLERSRLIERVPGRARSLRVLLPAEALPFLQEPPGRGSA